MGLSENSKYPQLWQFEPIFRGFQKWGYPQIIHFNRFFLDKTIHFGVPPFMETPQQTTQKNPPFQKTVLSSRVAIDAIGFMSMQLKPLHVLQEALARQLLLEEDGEHQPRQVGHLRGSPHFFAPNKMVRTQPNSKHMVIYIRWFHGNIALIFLGYYWY